MRIELIFSLAILAASNAAGFAQTLAIDHGPVGCAVAETYPKLDARFSPADSVATARVVFQPEKSDQWWSVAMKPEGNAYVGVLPKPQKSLKAFRYYLEVTGKAMGTARTPDYDASVVPSSGGCKGKLVSGAVSSASILLQGPAGVAGIPAGFASAGVVAGTSSAGAASAGAAAAGGGGVSTGLIVAGVGVAAAGAAVAVGVSKGEESNDNGGSGGGPHVTYDVFFTPPATLNLTPCGANANVTGIAGILPDASGNFSELHTQGTPVMRVTGQFTPTTFQASLACTNGAVTGSISATGANDSYSGTFVFGASSGPLTARKR